MGRILILLLPIIFIAGCIGQPPVPQAFHDNITMSPIIPCDSPPDASDPSICDRGSTAVAGLAYFASLATGFACSEGKFSVTCDSAVADAAGSVVLSGSSHASSTCDDRRVICQVPIDGVNMPAGSYTVTFTARDDNSGQSAAETLEITVRG